MGTRSADTGGTGTGVSEYGEVNVVERGLGHASGWWDLLFIPLSALVVTPIMSFLFILFDGFVLNLSLSRRLLTRISALVSSIDHGWVPLTAKTGDPEVMDLLGSEAVWAVIVVICVVVWMILSAVLGRMILGRGGFRTMLTAPGRGWARIASKMIRPVLMVDKLVLLGIVVCICLVPIAAIASIFIPDTWAWVGGHWSYTMGRFSNFEFIPGQTGMAGVFMLWAIMLFVIIAFAVVSLVWGLTTLPWTAVILFSLGLGRGYERGWPAYWQWLATTMIVAGLFMWIPGIIRYYATGRPHHIRLIDMIAVFPIPPRPILEDSMVVTTGNRTYDPVYSRYVDRHNRKSERKSASGRRGAHKS